MATFFGGGGGANADDIIAEIVDSAPETLNTLNELAAALNDDANFASTVTNSLASKAPIANPTFTGTVAGVTKAMVGLGNVDNTSDANKPISSATQTALNNIQSEIDNLSIYDITLLEATLDSKAALVHTHSVSDVTGLQTALDAKADSINPELVVQVTGTELASLSFNTQAVCGFGENFADNPPNFDEYNGGFWMSLAGNTPPLGGIPQFPTGTVVNILTNSTEYDYFGNTEWVVSDFNNFSSGSSYSWNVILMPVSPSITTEGMRTQASAGYPAAWQYQEGLVVTIQTVEPLTQNIGISNELAYLDGVSSNIQTQLDDKADLVNGFVDPSQLDEIMYEMPSPLYLAVGRASGNESPSAYYSADGITWNRSTMPGQGIDAFWQCSVFGNGKFVALGSRSMGSQSLAAYSTDGATWTSSTMPVETSWTSVTYAAGKFVAVSRGSMGAGSSNAAYSTDGISWTAATLPRSAIWQSVTYGNDKFVAVGREFMSGLNKAAYSTDGITWLEATLPSSDQWISVTYAAGKFVAVSPYSVGAYSTDGITWTASNLSQSFAWSSVTYGNGKFVAVIGRNDVSDIVAYSTDGISWSTSVLPSSQSWVSVTFGNGKFVAVSSQSGISPVYSTDGISWTAAPNQSETGLWQSIAYGEPTEIAPSPIASEAYVDSISDSLQTALDGKANSSHTHNMGQIVTTVTDKSSAYTIVAADENTFIRSTSATAVNMTINNVLNIGESVQFIQFGAGQITFVAGSGVNLRSVDNKLKTNKQYSVAAVTCVASGEYLVTGDLVA